jgi:hypothetical protein
MCLTDKLRENVKHGAELGSQIYLEKYESERLRNGYPKILGIHLLNTLYTNDGSQSPIIQTPLVLLRSLGLTLSNRLTFVKNIFAKEAMQ